MKPQALLFIIYGVNLATKILVSLLFYMDSITEVNLDSSHIASVV